MDNDFTQAVYHHGGDGVCPGSWLAEPGQPAPPVTVLVPVDQDDWLGVECGDCGVMLVEAS